MTSAWCRRDSLDLSRAWPRCTSSKTNERERSDIGEGADVTLLRRDLFPLIYLSNWRPRSSPERQAAAYCPTFLPSPGPVSPPLLLGDKVPKLLLDLRGTSRGTLWEELVLWDGESCEAAVWTPDNSFRAPILGVGGEVGLLGVDSMNGESLDTRER